MSPEQRLAICPIRYEQIIWSTIRYVNLQRQQKTIMNSQNRSRNSPVIDKQNGFQSHNSRSIKQEKEKSECLSCGQIGQLMCYACCYQFSCDQCYTSQHYTKCQKKFNHHLINLQQLAQEEQNISKRSGKKGKNNEKCQRCAEEFQKGEFCQQCKSIFCFQCSNIVHSIGKFMNHQRLETFSLSQNHKKVKKLQTFITESDQVEEIVMKKSTKTNLENTDYGLKANNKGNMNKMTPTPHQVKKGNSIAKVSTKNTQNMIASSIGRQRKHSNNFTSLQTEVIANKVSTMNPISKPLILNLQNEEKFMICDHHKKYRNVLVQGCDLICQECYQLIKSSTSKIKNIDFSLFVQGFPSQQIQLNFQMSLNQFNLKMKEIQAQFSKYRQNLLEQFNKKEELLLQRYNSNLMNLQKWEKIYKQSITTIISKCSQNLHFLANSSSLNSSPKKKSTVTNISKILQLKNMLSFEQISQNKKQYYILQDQYQFKISEINSQYFEDMLKNFTFARRKIDNEGHMSNYQQKSLSKISQSNQLRQSRLSNSSMKTDRKTLKRDQSFQKSHYYQLSNSNNLLKRSMSKEIKDDITKDISQKILFPTNTLPKTSGVNSDKKCPLSSNLKKIDQKQVRNSQYFFQSVQDQCQKIKAKSKKQPIQLSGYYFREVKFVDLQNFLTEKLDRIYDDKKQGPQISRVTEGHIRSVIQNESTPQTGLTCVDNSRVSSGQDVKMTQSINISAAAQHNLSKFIPESTPNSTNNSLHCNKNKRKSDYMEMRDRLRKPNIMQKINK